MSEIKVYLNNEWVPARDYQIEAYIDYQLKTEYFDRPYSYEKDGYKFKICREDNNPYNGSYLIREDGSRLPICDWNSCKAFYIPNTIFGNAQNLIYSNTSEMSNQPDFININIFLKWSFFDFIYNNRTSMTYITFNPNNHCVNEEHESARIYIPYEYSYMVIPSSKYTFVRNDNNSIYFRQGQASYQIRIADTYSAQMGYRGYYNRITSEIGMIVEGPDDKIRLDLPLDLIVEEDNDLQCGVCLTNKQNIIFQPCGHTETCSECYKQLLKINECPICKQMITLINKL